MPERSMLAQERGLSSRKLHFNRPFCHAPQKVLRLYRKPINPALLLYGTGENILGQQLFFSSLPYPQSDQLYNLGGHPTEKVPCLIISFLPPTHHKQPLPHLPGGIVPALYNTLPLTTLKERSQFPSPWTETPPLQLLHPLNRSPQFSVWKMRENKRRGDGKVWRSFRGQKLR